MLQILFYCFPIITDLGIFHCLKKPKEHRKKSRKPLRKCDKCRSKKTQGDSGWFERQPQKE